MTKTDKPIPIRPVPIRPVPIRTAADLMADIERRIADGGLQPGDRLAPVRHAAADLGLAPNTVSNAYRKLQDRGLVFGQGRRGTFVADRPTAIASSDQPVSSDLTDLASGNPDPALLPALGRVLAGIASDHVAYGHPSIDEQLGAALRRDLAPDLTGGPVTDLAPGKSLAVVGGALDGIERTLMAHLRTGDRVAVEDPAYSSVLNLTSALNLRAVPVIIDRFGMIPDQLQRTLGDGVEAVIITPRAQNPSGAAIDADRAADLRALFGQHQQLLIVEDDHAGPVAGAPYHCTIPPSAERWAVIRSVAKSLGPDLRLAALAADDTTVSRVIGRQLLGTGWVSHILQRTVARLLDEPETTTQLRAAANTYRDRRLAFVERLAAAGMAVDVGSGLNVWVPVEDEALVVAGMQERGFAVRSGARYRRSSAPAIRVSTAAADRATLIAAADALLDVLDGGPRTRSV